MYQLDKYYNKYISGFIDYEDEEINKLFEKYDVSRNTPENDKKLFELLYNKLYLKIQDYKKQYLNMLIENNKDNVYTIEELICKTNDYSSVLRDIIIEEDYIYCKLLELSNKYGFKII